MGFNIQAEALRAIQEGLEQGLAGATVLSIDLTSEAASLTLEHPTASLIDVASCLTLTPSASVHPGTLTHTFVVTLPTTPTQRAVHPVRVPPAIAAHVRAERDRSGLSATEQLLDAYATHYEQLAASSETRRRVLGLPPGAPQRRRGIGQTVQLWLNLNEAERDLLDASARQSWSGNRSAMATALFTARQNPPLTNH